MFVLLDFDGILHGHGQPVFKCLERFEEVLRALPVWQIVISSSWRESYPQEVLIELFAEDLRGRVVGATPVLRPEIRPVRQAGILAWLYETGHMSAHWVAVDDLDQLFEQGCPSPLLCGPDRGLDDEAAARLLQKCRVGKPT